MPLTRLLLPPAQQPSPTAFAIGLGIAVCLLGLAVYGIVRLSRRRRLGNRLHLFGELCRVHGLEAQDVGLLRRVAAKQDLTHPGMLFVEPQLFDQLISPPDGEFRQETLIRLRDRIFRGEDARIAGPVD